MPRSSYIACQIGSEMAIMNDEPLPAQAKRMALCQVPFILSNPALQLSSDHYWPLTVLAALLQHSSPFDFPISSESKYLGQERSYSNPSYSANDFSFSSRRQQSTLTNGASTQGVVLPTNSSLDFNGNSLLNDTPYHSNSHLLSPPDSTTGSASTSGNPTTSSIVYTALPKPPFLSNAGSDLFSSAPPSVLSSHWTGSSMTVMDRPRFPPPLSPPLSYNSANGIGAALLSNRSMVDRLPHTFHPNGHSSISSGLFQPPASRYTHNSYHRNSVGHYSMSDAPYPGSSMSASFQENSGPLRQDGPPFNDTSVIHPVLNVRNQPLIPEISASIQKGFFQVDRKWTCYRRNYFAVSCSFSFKNHMVEGPFYLHRNGREESIQQFAVSISAKTALTSNGESENRGLVQHTPKRDKATESVPGRHLISPLPLPTMSANGAFPSAGHLYGGHHHMQSTMLGGFGGYENSSGNSTPTTHTFERIQFQKATANNGKRRAQQQYFLVVVELSANIARTPGDENWVLIATKESDPMVVRGRSPGHYKDNGRRDSQASMDPDRGTGHGGEAPSASLPSSGYGHSLDWIGAHRQGNHFGGPTYRQAVNSAFSPASMASSSTLTGSPTETKPNLADFCAGKSCTLAADQSALTPLSEGSEDLVLSFERPSKSRKRRYEDEGEEDHLRYHLASPFTDSIPSMADFSALPYSKLLCAS